MYGRRKLRENVMAIEILITLDTLVSHDLMFQKLGQHCGWRELNV